jgi:hypothetical protein
MRTADDLALGYDELAIAFQGVEGLRAEDLGKFLQKAGAETRRNGVELRIVGFEPGSVLVRCRALSIKVGRNAIKEALENPIRTALTTAGVAIAATALANAMSADDGEKNALATEGARIVEQHGVQNIAIITIDDINVVMTPAQARRIIVADRTRPRKKSLFEELAEAFREEITGQVFDVGGVPHFRPDGFQFTVPIEVGKRYTGPRLMDLNWYSVKGVLRSRRGRPEAMEIVEASLL